MCGVSCFNTLLFLTELMIIKAMFFFGQIWISYMTLMICIEILFLYFLWRKWPHLDNHMFLEAATTYIARGFTKISTCRLSHLSSKFGLIPLDIYVLGGCLTLCGGYTHRNGKKNTPISQAKLMPWVNLHLYIDTMVKKQVLGGS